MTRAVRRDPIYRHRRFSPEIIETCVRWYITYRLSYGDLVSMMAERGVVVSHTTIMRWVLRYVPEFENRWSRYARPVHSSWRMDETAVSVRGGPHYLYRAVDKQGRSIGSLLRPLAACTPHKSFSHRCRRRSISMADHRALAVEREKCVPAVDRKGGDCASARSQSCFNDQLPRR
jgi:transposase-like protein